MSGQPQVGLEVWVVANLPPPVHGPARYTEALVQSLRSRGVLVRVFQVGARGALSGVDRPSVGKAIRDLGTLVRIWAASVRRHMRGGSLPVVYFTPSQGGASVVRDRLLVGLARWGGIPIVGHVHGCAWLEHATGPKQASNPLTARLLRETAAGVTTLIWLGPTYANRVAHEMGLMGVPVANGVGINNAALPPAQPASAPNAPARAKRPEPGGRLELLYLSNLMRSKGLWVAAEAAMLLEASGVPVRLRCAGVWYRDAERAEFMAYFQEALERGTVTLEGFANEAQKTELLQTSSLFLLPVTHRFEGQPLAILEAMAAGVVPIVTAHGGIPDLFDFDGGATLCRAEHEDPTVLAETVQVLSDPERWVHHSDACRRHVEGPLAWVPAADAVYQVLAEAWGAQKHA